MDVSLEVLNMMIGNAVALVLAVIAILVYHNRSAGKLYDTIDRKEKDVYEAIGQVEDKVEKNTVKIAKLPEKFVMKEDCNPLHVELRGDLGKMTEAMTEMTASVRVLCSEVKNLKESSKQ